MSMVDAQAGFLLDVCSLVKYATAQGFTLTAGELYRTPEQQEIYMKTGRSQTMESMHLKRLAVDFNIFKNGKLCYDKATLASLGAYWESLNPLNSWGGNGKKLVDTPHFSRGVNKPEWVRVT